MNTRTPMSTNRGNGQDGNQPDHGVDGATSAAHDTIESVSDAAKPALDNLVSGAHGAVDRAGVAVSNAADALGEKGEQLSANTQKALENTEGYVREHPLASIGMAVAAGYVLSRLLSSR